MKRSISMLCLLFILSLLGSISKVRAQNYYGAATDNELIYKSIKTPDGGAIHVGLVFNGSGPSDMLIFKTNTNGTVDWRHRYNNHPTAVEERIYRIIKTSDNNYVFVGLTRSPDSTYASVVVKIDVAGNIIWQRWLKEQGATTGNGDIGQDIVEMAGGSIAVVGSNRTGGSSANGFVTLLNSAGVIQWTRITDYGDTDEFYGVTNFNGDILALGIYTNSNHDGFLMRITTAGTVVWARTYNFSDAASGNNVNWFLEANVVGPNEVVISSANTNSLVSDIRYSYLSIAANGSVIRNTAVAFGAFNYTTAYCRRLSGGDFVFLQSPNNGIYGLNDNLAPGLDFYITRVSNFGLSNTVVFARRYQLTGKQIVQNLTEDGSHGIISGISAGGPLQTPSQRDGFLTKIVLADGSLNVSDSCIPTSTFTPTFTALTDTNAVARSISPIAVNFAHTNSLNEVSYNLGSTQFCRPIDIGDSTELCDPSCYWTLLGNHTSPNSFIGTLNANPFRIRTNGSERLIISATGNVGIGTTTPNTRLELNSGVSGQSGLRFTQPINYTAPTGNALAVNSSGDVVLVPLMNDHWKISGNEIDPSCESEFIGTTTTADLRFRTDNVHRMRLTATGSLSVEPECESNSADRATNLMVGQNISITNSQFNTVTGTQNQIIGEDGFNNFITGVGNTLENASVSSIMGANLLSRGTGTLHFGSAREGTQLVNSINSSAMFGWGSIHTTIINEEGMAIKTSTSSEPVANTADVATARLDVEASPYTSEIDGGNRPSGVRLRNLPRNSGQVLVVDDEGYIYRSEEGIAKPQGNNSELEELKKQVALLQAQVKALMDAKSISPCPETSKLLNSLDILPNPFAEQAKVVYNLPSLKGSAYLQIVDAKGIIIKRITLSNSSGEVNVSGCTTTSGMLLFNIYDANNNLLVSKKSVKM